MLREHTIYREKNVISYCPDEVNFTEMFESLGNREAQEIIRQSNPRAQHCELLIMTPNACIGCPKNPHKVITDCDIEFLEENNWLLNYAYDLLDQRKVGLEILNSAEFVLLKMISNHEKIQDQLLQARLIRSEIAKLFTAPGN